MFKVPEGTKVKLKRLGKMSDLLRELVKGLLDSRGLDNAHAKGQHLICDGPGNLSTGRDYLKQYAPKAHR